MRRLLLVCLPAALACQQEPDPTDDTDVETDTETDVVVGPTDTDTDVETQDTDLVPVATTIQALRRNELALPADYIDPGTFVEIRDAVVVAVRGGGTDADGFVVQAPDVTSFGGLFVSVGAGGALPARGAVVIVRGIFREYSVNPLALAPNQTETRIEITSAEPYTGFIVQGTAAVPAPLEVSLRDLNGAYEVYESMRVRVLDVDGDPLYVVQDPVAGRFQLANTQGGLPLFSPAPAAVDPFYFDVTTTYPTLSQADTFASMAGVVRFDASGYALCPLSGADAAGYERPDTDVETDLTDLPETDTDTDTDLEPTDTDTDTDLRPTDTDTFQSAGTDSDTDDDVSIVDVNIGSVRNFPVGRLVRVQGAVVTAVRFRTSPVASNSFTIQDGLFGGSGITVFVADCGRATTPACPTLPAIGDLVEVVGEYREEPVGTTITNSVSRLVANPNVVPGTYYTVTGTGTLPMPVPVTLDQLEVSVTSEPYESMYVEILEPNDLVVRSNPQVLTLFRRFNVGTTGTLSEIEVRTEFHDLIPAFPFTIAVNGTMTSLRGVIRNDNGAYSIAPTANDDLVGYTP